MIVLALDTCLGACSAALTADGASLAWASEAMTRGHQERLAPMVREVLAKANIPAAAIDRIGVTIGPGSFTGLRVGLAFAKGLALALGQPCVGIGTLESLAASIPAGGGQAAAIDAGRGRLYLQLFDRGQPLRAPGILTVEAAAARLVELRGAGAVTLVGPGAALLAHAVADADLIALTAPCALAVARLAAGAPLAAPRPLYLRPPDARLKTS